MSTALLIPSGVRQQGNAEYSVIYQLVDLKGGGKLIEEQKKFEMGERTPEAEAELNRKICECVAPFLYYRGEGRYVKVQDLVKMKMDDQRQNEDKDSMKSKAQVKSEDKKRHKKKSAEKFDDIVMVENDNRWQGPCQRFQCWDIEKRGTVGETILHLCCLNASQIHANLAKRLLKLYPLMVNDIYIGDEFYGETALHLAIANEDPAMVKLLLDTDADVRARVCGNFFTPDDQKESRTNLPNQECVILCEKTNYKGNAYWGDYPLSFAACLDLEECVRLLLAKGADPNWQDSNGNTCMHMLVIHENQKMFDLLHSYGGRLDSLNKQNLIPLTLAAKLGRKKIFQHILKIGRKVLWCYGNVTAADYPLKHLDSVLDNGEINLDSALHLIVKGKKEEHLDMMEGLIVELFKSKWEYTIKFRFYRRFFMFICYFLVFGAAFYLRPSGELCVSNTNSTNIATHNSSLCNQTEREADSCYLISFTKAEDKARMTLEAFVLLGSVFYIFLAMKEIYFQGIKRFFVSLMDAPAKAIFLLSCLLVISMLPCRAVCASEAEDIIGVIAILTTSPYFLFFCRGFHIIGPFVVMIYTMIRQDLLRVFVIFIVFLLGFSQAIYIPFRTMDTVFSTPLEAILSVFSLSVGDFEEPYETFSLLASPFQGIIKVTFVVYMILVTLLVVNMFIAMMVKTFHTVTNTQKEWFRQWANVLLIMEQAMSTSTRSKEVAKYSEVCQVNGRVYRVRWRHTVEEKEELDLYRQENKIYQRAVAKQYAAGNSGDLPRSGYFKFYNRKNNRDQTKRPGNSVDVHADVMHGPDYTDFTSETKQNLNRSTTYL